LGTNPASTAAREAPTAAPSLSANWSSMVKFSPDCMPRPPDTMTRALVNSGRSDLESSSPTNLETPASGAAGTGSIVALPPSAAAASNAVPRTVITLIGSGDCTVAIALPA
jgi:hypothetical protein